MHVAPRECLMVDIVDQASRSRMMAGIRGKNTKPEILVRSYLHRSGLRFRIHVKDLPGKPDIVLPKYKTALFVHGCFWHRHARCKFATVPTSNVEFWAQKLDANRERDRRNKRLLIRLGWRVLIIWECQLDEPHLSSLVEKIKANGQSE